MKFRFTRMLRDQLHLEFPNTDKRTILGLALLVAKNTDKYSLEETFNNLFEKEFPGEKFSEEEMTKMINEHHIDFAKKNITM